MCKEKELILSKKTSIKDVLIKNFGPLMLSQIAQYIFQIAIILKVTRTLGPSNFGLAIKVIALGESLSSLAIIGTDRFAIREIAKGTKKVDDFSADIISFRFLNGLLLGGMLAIGILLSRSSAIYFISILIIIFNVMNIRWYLFGKERMIALGMISVLVKFLFMAMVFIFIRSKEDFFLYILFYAGSIALLDLALFITAPIKNFFGKFYFRPKNYWAVFRKTFSFFVGIFSSQAMNNFTIVLLGFLTSTKIVGFFSAALKLINPIASMFDLLFQSFYPRISSIMAQAKESVKKFQLRASSLLLFSILNLSFILFLSSKLICNLALGSAYSESIPIIKLLSFFLFFSLSERMLANLILYPEEKETLYAKVLFSGAIFHIGFFSFLSKFFPLLSASISLLFTECIIFLLILFKIREEISIKKMLKFFIYIIGLSPFIFVHFDFSILISILMFSLFSLLLAIFTRVITIKPKGVNIFT